MQRILILVILLALPILSYSQDVVKMKAKFMAVNLKDDYGKWQDWSETVECNILVTYNIDKELITVYLEKEQEYAVISTEVTELENEVIFDFICIGDSGEKYQVELVKDTDSGETGKITFIGENMAWVYLLIWL